MLDLRARLGARIGGGVGALDRFGEHALGVGEPAGVEQGGPEHRRQLTADGVVARQQRRRALE